MLTFHHNNTIFETVLITQKYNIYLSLTLVVTFGREQETSYHFFRSIGESESEDPTLTETLARRLS